MLPPPLYSHRLQRKLSGSTQHRHIAYSKMGAAKTSHPNTAILESVYRDLTIIATHATDDVVLHPAIRAVDPAVSDVIGREAVLAWERALISAAKGTLQMDVEHIIANDKFGTVLGTLRARFGEVDFSQAFCGLWRFRDGQITEHWENIYDPQRLMTLMATTV